MLIDGKALAQRVREETAREAAALRFMMLVRVEMPACLKRE